MILCIVPPRPSGYNVMGHITSATSIKRTKSKFNSSFTQQRNILSNIKFRIRNSLSKVLFSVGIISLLTLKPISYASSHQTKSSNNELITSAVCMSRFDVQKWPITDLSKTLSIKCLWKFTFFI